MKHRILSLIAAIVLCLSVCPVQALAAETEGEGVPPVVDTGTPPAQAQKALRKAARAGEMGDDVTILDGFLFANGIPIVIKQNGSITSVYDTDGKSLSNDTDVSGYSIYGGWFDGNNEHTADTSVVMESGTVRELFGGSFSGVLNGNTYIEINGGEISTNCIFGGGNQSKVTGVTNVVLNSGTCKNVYGGGYSGTVEEATITLGVDWGDPSKWVYAGGYDDVTNTSTIIIQNYKPAAKPNDLQMLPGTAKNSKIIVRKSTGGPNGTANPDYFNLVFDDTYGYIKNVEVEYGTVTFLGRSGQSLALDSLDIGAEAQVDFQNWSSIDIKEISSNGGQFLFPAHFGGSGLIKPTPITVGNFSITSPMVLKAEGSGWSTSALQDTVFFKGPGVDNLTSLKSLFFSEGYIVDRRDIAGGSGKGIYLLPKSADESIYISKLEFNNGSVPYNGKISLTVGVAQHLATIDHLEVIPGARIQIRGNNSQRVLLADVQVSDTGKTATVTDMEGNTWEVELGEGDYITFELPVNAALLDTSEEGLLMIATTDRVHSNSVPLVGPDGSHKIEITPTPITLTNTVPEPAFEDPLESDLEEGPFYTASVRWHPAAAGVSSAFQLDRDYQADIILTPKAGHWLSAESIGSTVTYNGQPVDCVFNTDGTVTLPNQKTARFQSRTVTVAASPAAGGTVTGGGRYLAGTRVTVTATPAQNWQFVGWEENGSIVSTQPEYIFAANANRTLAARFQKIQYTVTLTAAPAEGGTVTGAGSYEIGSPVTVTATPAPGWKFTGWCEGETVISADAEYAFSIAANRALTARFASEKMKPDCNALTSPPGDLANHPDFNTVEKITAKLRQVVEAHISGVGNNLAVYDVILVYEDTGLPVEPENFPASGIDAVLPYPDGTNGTDYTFTIQHMISYGPSAGTVENMSYTAGTDGLTCHFTSLSPVAIGWQKKNAVRPTPTGGSSGSEKSNDEYDFWQEVRRKIEKAESGDTVRVNARGYDKMSWTVMDALKNHSVTLVIQWSGGEDIVIPAGKALDEPSRIYYPLSYLAGYRFGTAAVNPETGGVWLVEAPASAEPALTSDGTPRITDARRGLAETPELARQGIEKAVADEPAGPAAEPATAPKDSAAAPVLLLLAVSACGGLWAWKTRKDRPGN